MVNLKMLSCFLKTKHIKETKIKTEQHKIDNTLTYASEN
jgi:hypothetical protein